VVSEKDCTYCLANPERKRKVEGKWHVPQWAEERCRCGMEREGDGDTDERTEKRGERVEEGENGT